MSARRWPALGQCRPGHQRHHLLPLSLLTRPQMADFLAQLNGAGGLLSDFAANGQWLPATERLAAETGLALHRGPHPAYSDVVAARVDQIRSSADMASVAGRWATRARLATLQAALRRALTDQHRLRFWLNRRDPMRVFADRAYLDDAITALFADS
jgi:hypothetical protein